MPGRDDVIFRLATSDDDAELRRLLRENPMGGEVSISLELQNLTNEQLLTYFRSDPLTPRASFAPGRQMLLGISGKF